MNADVVRLWFLKADNDLKTGKDELRTDDAATDTVCFHMQQCVEKYLKAYLVFNNREISKTHNLTILLQQCIEIDQEFERLHKIDADELSVYAVDTRYPDDFYMPTMAESNDAVTVAEQVRDFVRNKISRNG